MKSRIFVFNTQFLASLVGNLYYSKKISQKLVEAEPLHRCFSGYATRAESKLLCAKKRISWAWALQENHIGWHFENFSSYVFSAFCQSRSKPNSNCVLRRWDTGDMCCSFPMMLHLVGSRSERAPSNFCDFLISPVPRVTFCHF